ncbi:cation efflux protein [Lentithecium fluviatile CBS 122367]|uniref:Zinc transporter n=1 Tax=Lentithecium fluviatile CBS 122367 TaxID=1168545 RepID=A0A6G1JCG5_9PLEO|nr:cation efflux protein [Lentithecium fluviatile CBS 122367]
MASTYAIPFNPATQPHGHRHSRSHYSSDQSVLMNGQANGASPSRGQPPSAGGHQHHRTQSNGQLPPPILSPYGNGHDHTHEHGHSHARSTDSTYTLKPFMNTRPKGRPRGESDLGRPVQMTGRKFGFSPIHEAPPQLPASPSSSWLELPEALTALLIPLPYLFASLAYPSIVAQARRLPSALSETVAEPHAQASQPSLVGGQLLHACTLSSTTLLLVGLIAKIRSSMAQPLDRRKSFASPEKGSSAVSGLVTGSSLLRLITNALSVLLPFYATMQLGGARTSLILLAAATAGLGSFAQKPGKHSAWEDTKRTLRTRRWTIGALLLGMFADTYNCADEAGILLGYLAFIASVFAIPPPLPTAGWILMTGAKSQDAWITHTSGRASLPKPSSPLVNTPQDTLLTIASGVLLTAAAVLYSSVSSSSPSLSHHAILFSTLSVASATALVYFSLPAALRNPRKGGLALGSLLVAAFGVWEHADSLQACVLFPLTLASLVGAISIDTGSSTIVRPHSHDHSHAAHQHSHSHDHGEHHLHGNHSEVSTFLIARCTPGSILHSILIEKDSRRIAYFGVLNLAFMVVQFFYGYVSGSLGLLTDSIHMLFDCAGLAVGLAAAVMSKWRPNARFPYGYGKIDTLSGFANGVFLLLVSLEIIFDAVERLWEGHELHRLNELLVVSTLGFVVNIVGLTAFGHAHHGHGHSHDHDHGDHGHSHGHSHDNENMQGIFLHILADALGSVAVIISTLLTKYYGWSGWDPIASCIIAVLIFVSAIPLVKSSGARLMLSLPADVEYGIRNTLQELSSLRGVVGYTVPKFWLEDEGAAHAEVHAKEQAGCGHDHSHAGHDHKHDHSDDDHPHDSQGGHSHDHSHGHAHHDHDHDHDHAPRQPRILGVIHIIASRVADLEDVRERTAQFLKGRGMEAVVHVEKEGDGRCWCGGGNKSS